MKITLVQSRGLIMDPTVNFYKARMRINNVESDIFIFPEMFCSGYTGDGKRMMVDSLQDKVVKKLSDLSVNRGCTIFVGCPIRDGETLYDSAMAISGKEITEYRKMILSTDGAFDETEVFTAGNRPMIVDHMGLKIGVSIGYDLLSTNLFRYYAENDVDIIFCMSAFDEQQMNRFDKIVKSKAAEYSMPIILCNMVGPDCGVNLIGRSKFIGYDGEVIESCTESSDVRVLNIDEEMFEEAKAKRNIIPEIELGECINVQTESGNGEHKEICAYTGEVLEKA